MHQPPKGKLAAAPGRGGRHYNPSRAAMHTWSNEAAPQVPNKYHNSVAPTEMHIDAFFQRPAAHFDRRGALKRDAPRRHTQTPDADNIAKFIGDALKGLAFQDDRFVYRVSAFKRWTTEESRTTVTLKYDT